MIRRSRVVTIVGLVVFTMALISPLWAQQILDSCYVPDVAFPQFAQFWGDSGAKEQALLQGRLQKEPLAGTAHIYLLNSGRRPLVINDVLMEGLSLTAAVAASEKSRVGRGVPASLYFSALPEADRARLVKAGEPVWWKVEPQTVGPGQPAEVIVRLRKPPEQGGVRFTVKVDGAVSKTVVVSVKKDVPRIEGISFSPSLDSVYVYLRHPSPGRKPVRLLVDGRDVTRDASIGSDPDVETVPVVLRLDKPLAKASLHCVQAVYDDGSTASAAIRAWSDEMAYGIWGSKPGRESDTELARSYIKEIAEHNINVQMEMVASGAVSAFLRSDAGHQEMNSLGIRRMVSGFGKGNEKEPFAYFLMDEPDAGDFRIDSVPPLQRVGCLAEAVIGRSEQLRKADPLTPNLLNVDMTFKPYNYYIYGQIPDIFAADPYYQERLRQAYWEMPGRVPAYAKATFVYAVGTVGRSACAPKPLHLILNSVRRTQKDRQFRFATPAEKRIEVYYSLAAGAKGLSYWWYRPTAPSYGCGGPEPEAVALWREIGLLGAEVRTVGPLITRSVPTSLNVEAPPKLWVRSLLAGLDTIVVLCVNDDYTNDRLGTVIRPVDNARVAVDLPKWMRAESVFEVDSHGTHELQWTGRGGKVEVPLGKVEVTRLLVITSDKAMQAALQSRYDTEFAANVARLESQDAAQTQKEPGK